MGGTGGASLGLPVLKAARKDANDVFLANGEAVVAIDSCEEWANGRLGFRVLCNFTDSSEVTESPRAWKY